MYDIDRAIRRLELAQRIDELQRQKAATADQGLPLEALSETESTLAVPADGATAPDPLADAPAALHGPLPPRHPALESAVAVVPAARFGAESAQTYLPIAELAARHLTGERADANATPNDATPNDATPNDATPNDATPNDATPNDATPNDATPNDATPNYGAAATPANPLPQPVAPMPLANWASPPRADASELPATITRVVADRPRPSAADLLPRAVVSLSQGPLGTDSSRGAEVEVPGPRGGSGDEASYDSAAEEPVHEEPVHEEPVHEELAEGDPAAETLTVDLRGLGNHDRTDQASGAPVEATGTPAHGPETPTDGSLTAASIIADLLRHGNRSLLR